MKNNIIVINGPNLNLLGGRERSQYGSVTYDELKNNSLKYSKTLAINIEFTQSNIEGEIITIIQEAKKKYDALINEFSSKLFPVSLGAGILNSLGEYFFSSFGNKLHISLYFPILFDPTNISLIFFISL